MAMSAFCSCSSSALLAYMGVELRGQRMRRTRNQPGELYVWGSAISCRNGNFGKLRNVRDSVTIRAVVAGDGEEVEESERPKSMSSKTRPKTTSSTMQRPASLGSKKSTSGPKKVKSANIISALFDDIAGFMAPREKGDIRDVVLMSFSFALFIYISQHLVHAYCVLKHTLQPFHHF